MQAVWNWLSLHPAFQEKQTAHYHYTTILEQWQSNHNLLSLYALLLKEPCHKIYQNSRRNRHQIQWNIKTTSQTMKRRDKNNNTAYKYKRAHGWTYLKKIEADCSWVFEKLVSLMCFWSSFSLLQSRQVKHTPQDSINELIIWKMNPLVVPVTSVKFKSAFLHT